jgi:DNA-binding beta-propeller fold protein YncE
VTGVGARVGKFNVPNPEIDGLAFHPVTGELFGLAQNGNVYKINTNTGQATLIGPLGFAINEAGLAFDNAGNLFGVDTSLDRLFAIDPSTGQATLKGPLGFEDIRLVAKLSREAYVAAWTHMNA